jgi:hypothetical protein
MSLEPSDDLGLQLQSTIERRQVRARYGLSSCLLAAGSADDCSFAAIAPEGCVHAVTQSLPKAKWATEGQKLLWQVPALPYSVRMT